MCVCAVVERGALFSISFSSLGQKNRMKKTVKKQTKIRAGRSTNSSPATLSLCLFRRVREVGSKGKRRGRDRAGGAAVSERGAELLLLL